MTKIKYTLHLDTNCESKMLAQLTFIIFHPCQHGLTCKMLDFTHFPSQHGRRDVSSEPAGLCAKVWRCTWCAAVGGCCQLCAGHPKDHDMQWDVVRRAWCGKTQQKAGWTTWTVEPNNVQLVSASRLLLFEIVYLLYLSCDSYVVLVTHVTSTFDSRNCPMENQDPRATRCGSYQPMCWPTLGPRKTRHWSKTAGDLATSGAIWHQNSFFLSNSFSSLVFSPSLSSLFLVLVLVITCNYM